MPVRCSPTRCRATSTSRCATGSSPRPVAIRWGCSSCPRGMTPSGAGRRLRRPDHHHRSGQIEDHYLRRVQALPQPTQRLMLLAAADPTGDATLLWRADARARHRTRRSSRGRLGAAARDRLPRAVSPSTRAIGGVRGRRRRRIDRARTRRSRRRPIRENDPERRVWHLAAAATGPDEIRRVGARTHRGPGSGPRRAAGGGGVPPTRGGLDRRPASGAPTGRWPRRRPTCTPARSTRRVACWPKPPPPRSTICSVPASSNSTDRSRRPRGPDARRRLGCCRPRRRLESLDVQLARDTYLQAWWAAVLAGQFAAPGGDLLEVSNAARCGSAGRGTSAVRPAPRRSGDDDHRGASGGGTDAASEQSICFARIRFPPTTGSSGVGARRRPPSHSGTSTAGPG